MIWAITFAVVTVHLRVPNMSVTVAYMSKELLLAVLMTRELTFGLAL